MPASFGRWPPDRVPRAWRALETTTTEETTFLSPLDPVSARGRAAQLFGFEYKWEVYTPAAQRRYGYYVLPVLWGDRLVARFDAQFERATRTLHVLGLWFEDPGLVDDPALAAAFERGMARFAGYLGAERIDTSGLADRSLRSWRTRLAAIRQRLADRPAAAKPPHGPGRIGGGPRHRPQGAMTMTSKIRLARLALAGALLGALVIGTAATATAGGPKILDARWPASRPAASSSTV